MRPARTEAATHALSESDVDYAFLSTDPGWRREVSSARTEAAVDALSDVDYAFLSTDPGWRREMSSARTEAAADAPSDVDFAFLSTASSWPFPSPVPRHFIFPLPHYTHTHERHEA